MDQNGPRPLEPEPLLTIRGKGLLKLAAGISAAIVLFIIITASRLVEIPFVGKYFVVLPAIPLVFAFVGAIEALTGQSVVKWSTRWHELPLATRSVITVVAIALAIGAAALVSLLRRGS